MNTKPRLRRILLMLFVFMLFNSFHCWPSVTSLHCRLRSALTGSGVPRRTQFWPFTGVLQKIRRDITRNVWIFQETADYADKTDKSPDLKPRMNTNSHK